MRDDSEPESEHATNGAGLVMREEVEVASDEAAIEIVSDGPTLRKSASRDAPKTSSQILGEKIHEPDGGTIIRFSTNRHGGYTYVAFRIPHSGAGEASWYPTGVQRCMECYVEDNEGELQACFPFNGIVTWGQILEFAADNPIYIATQWQVHPDRRGRSGYGHISAGTQCDR
jgi:hypothetical protein